MTYSILTEKINIKVHKNASEYFTVTYIHKTWKYLR